MCATALCCQHRYMVHFSMQKYLNQSCCRVLSHDVTAVSAANIIDNGYQSHCLKSGQFCLQQPFQRSSRHQLNDKQPDRAGQKRKRIDDEESVHGDDTAGAGQQLQSDRQTIIQAHQQLLQVLGCRAQPSTTLRSSLLNLNTPTIADQYRHTTRDLLTAANPAANAPESTIANSAATDPPSLPAVRSKVASAQHTTHTTSGYDQTSADGDNSKAVNSTDSTDWLALADMRHVLKPKITFSYSTAPQTNIFKADQQPISTQQQVSCNLFNCLVTNPSPFEVVATAFNGDVLLPPSCSFCMSDLKVMQPFVQAVQQLGGASLLVIDPPWENASARRSAKYKTLTPNHLLWLPIKHLLRQDQGTLVALWMTNRPRLHKFTREKLLPTWGLQHVATWFWLKVTDTGEPVTPLGSMHRQPYEQLWLARVTPAEPQAVATSCIDDEGGPTGVGHQGGLLGQKDEQCQQRLESCDTLQQPRAQQQPQQQLQEQQQDLQLEVPVSEQNPAGLPAARIPRRESLQDDQAKDVGVVSNPVSPPTTRFSASPVEVKLIDCMSSAADSPQICCHTATAAGSVLQPPDRHVLISVPGEHSRKPHLEQLLMPYVWQQGQLLSWQQQQQLPTMLQADPKSAVDPSFTAAVDVGDKSTVEKVGNDLVRVELFARALFPGWLSWGDEAIKFQSMHYWNCKQHQVT